MQINTFCFIIICRWTLTALLLMQTNTSCSVIYADEHFLLCYLCRWTLPALLFMQTNTYCSVIYADEHLLLCYLCRWTLTTFCCFSSKAIIFLVPTLDPCLQEAGTPVLGPVWISCGGGFSPSGASKFLQDIVSHLRRSLKDSKYNKTQVSY